MKHPNFRRAMCASASILLLSATSAAGAAVQSWVRPNPYLAQSYNNQTHWNDAATDSVPFAVPRGHFEVTPASVQSLPNESASLPLVTDTVAGKPIYWWWAGFSLRKLTVEHGKLVELARSELPVSLPDYKAVPDDERRQQIAAIGRLLAARDEQGLLDYMKAQPNRLMTFAEDQFRNGVIYSVLDNNDTFFGGSMRHLFRIEQDDPKSPTSGMKAPRVVQMPDSLFDNGKVARAKLRMPVDVLFGMGMSYNGFLVINTLGGKVATIDRNTMAVIDTFTVPGEDELFMNSFATGPEADGGAVYVASNSNMYRLVVDRDGRIHSDEASGAWVAPYDRGVAMPAPKIGDGTGSTPTLMGFGPDEDKLVVITDGAEKMRLVAFWRDQLPAGWTQRPGTPSVRVADQREVDMGPGIGRVQSEQSVSAYGDYAFIVNNMPGEDKPAPAGGGTYVGLINGATRPGPAGVATFKWNRKTHAWQQKWVRTDVSSISIVPMISGKSHMAIIDGFFTSRWNDRYHIGFDLDTGRTVMTIRTGTDPTFNGMFAPIKADPQGHLFYSGASGLFRLDTTKMKRVSLDKTLR